MYYRLSRFSTVHHALRKAAYAVLWRLPDGFKYAVGSLWRRFRLPYRLLGPGDVVIQIGAPWDTLRAGRSRAVHFARRVGDAGRVIAIEPAPDNVTALEQFARRNRLASLSVIPKGAWSRKARLRFLVNPEHPASNLVEEVWDAEEQRDRSRYDATEIEVDTVDAMAPGQGPVRLLSITTNGSELEILKGAARTLQRIEYVSVITPRADEILKAHGFSAFGHDDRGYTYRRTNA